MAENRKYAEVKRKALEEEEKAAELPEEGELQNAATESAKDKSAANLTSQKPSIGEIKAGD